MTSPPRCFSAVLCCLPVLIIAARLHAEAFRAGAARVDITPDAQALPSGYSSVADPIYTRAIVIDNGTTSALLMNGDLPGIPEKFWLRVSGEISQATGVPVDHMLISATHDHSSPFLAEQAGLPGGTANRDAYAAKVERGMIEAAKQAKASMQPARIAFGTGSVNLNVNRDAIDLDTRLWAQEPNPLYPSDKTLAVVEFVRSDGTPIAIYMNYAMHAVSLFLRGDVSGDFPGAAERYVESVYDNKMVAMWTSGAAGDQNPLYLRAIHPITQARIAAERDPSKSDDGPGKPESNAALTRLMRGVARTSPPAVDSRLKAQSTAMVESMGQIIAEEALRVVASLRRYNAGGAIAGSTRMVSCPGRRRVDNARQGVPGRYVDTDPVSLRIGQLQIGEVVFGLANAELYTGIGMRVKQESPFNHTIMVTLTDGAADTGYVPTDDAFARYTFQVLSSRLKPGCAEQSIVNGIIDLMEQDFLGTGVGAH